MKVTSHSRRLTRNLEVEALEEIVSWPDASLPAVLALAGEFMAARLNRLREKHQQLSPFKFIIYSERGGIDRPPVE